MRHVFVFLSWLSLELAYLVAGALLIPYGHRVAYDRTPKDLFAYASNALWWGVPATWLLAPAAPPLWVWAMGAATFAGGAALLIWARRVNPFFLPVIREPRWIVEEGPYRWMKHPGYIAFVAMAEGSWLMLGHWLGVVPLGGFVGFLIARAQRENRILSSLIPNDHANTRRN